MSLECEKNKNNPKEAGIGPKSYSIVVVIPTSNESIKSKIFIFVKRGAKINFLFWQSVYSPLHLVQLIADNQCDQIPRLYFNIWPFLTRLNFCQILNKPYKNYPKTFKMLQKWRQMAKSGRTGVTIALAFAGSNFVSHLKIKDLF